MRTSEEVCMRKENLNIIFNSMLLGMIHQPNSLDSVDGEPLPFDTIPVRFEPGEFIILNLFS